MEDSGREEIFDNILTNNRTLLYVSKNLNTEGDYKGSPKHSDYIQYSVFMPFTDDELKDNPIFTNTILVPEKYIVKIAEYKKKIYWTPEHKNRKKGYIDLDTEVPEKSEKSIKKNPTLLSKYKATNIFIETKKKPEKDEIIKLIKSSYKIL